MFGKKVTKENRKTSLEKKVPLCEPEPAGSVDILGSPPFDHLCSPCDIMVRDNQNANENNQIHNRIEIEHSANTTENDDNTNGSGKENMALPADNRSTPLLIVLVLRHPDEKSRMYFT